MSVCVYVCVGGVDGCVWVCVGAYVCMCVCVLSSLGTPTHNVSKVCNRQSPLDT